MTDEVIIQEAIRLVDEGVSVTFPVKGWSMLPFIIGGRESIIMGRPESVKKGDVVLAWIPQPDPVCSPAECGELSGRYVVHRIVSIDGERVTLMGDGNIAGREHCRLADVKALATHVVDAQGRQHPLYSPRRVQAVRLWTALLPVRRYLLAVYRRVMRLNSKQ